QAYESFELSFLEADRAATRADPACTVPSDEVVVVDADVLEHGVTEMIPVVRRPRWTPDFAHVPSVVAEQRRPATIAPRAQRDQVAGEIDWTDLTGKRR